MSDSHQPARSSTRDRASATDAAATDARAGGDAGAQGDESLDAEELAAQVAALREENERLRRSYARARQTRYRWSALAFVLLGLLATGGAALFPDQRSILLALGGTGAFAGVLTWFVTPERFVAASVGRTVFESAAANYEALRADLGLGSTRVYVPAGETDDVRLFVPQRQEFDVPDADALSSALVVTREPSERGLALTPSGRGLFREFERGLQGSIPDEPGPLAEALREALVEQFEVADGVATDLDPAEGRLTLEATDSAYGPLDAFDHPLVSFVAVGLARGLDQPVGVEIASEEEPFATLRWETADEEGDTGADAERAETTGE